MKIAAMIVPFKDNVYRHEENLMQVDSALFEYADDFVLVHEEDDEDLGKQAGWKKTLLEGKEADRSSSRVAARKQGTHCRAQQCSPARRCSRELT